MRRREWAALFAFVLAWRLCHNGALWIEEAYPMTGAIELLKGRWPYRDFWFDKPPGAIFFYALIGAWAGWPLRLLGAVYVTLCCWLAAGLGGRWSAWLLAVYLSLGIPSAVMAVAPDLLLVGPHLAAVRLAKSGRGWAAGCVSGLALLVHTKGVLVLAAALLWRPDWKVAAGFGIFLPLQFAFGEAYWRQVWDWGRVYSAHPLAAKPLAEFGQRTLNWMGFQAAAIAAIQWKARLWGWRWWAWCGLGLVSVALGFRFFPRYYFFLLVPVVVMAGQALRQIPGWRRIALLSLLLIPALRFGPRNVRLAFGDESWDDLALYRDSRAVAEVVRAGAKPQDSLFVWGYRPDISALARLSSGTPYLESQPLDCVFADRHLLPAVPMQGVGCEERLAKFQAMRPSWIADGLGPLNPRLRLELYYPLGDYEVVHRTKSVVLYRRASPRDLPVEARRASPDASAPREAGSHPVGR